MKAVVQSLPSLSTEDRDRWVQSLLYERQCDRTAQIAMMLPCLEKLVIEDPNAIHNNFCNSLGFRPRPTINTLSKLSRVELKYGGGSCRNGTASVILYFDNLVSMHHLQETSLHDSCLLWADIQQGSALIKLVLDGCKIHPITLEHTIGSTEALQKFLYLFPYLPIVPHTKPEVEREYWGPIAIHETQPFQFGLDRLGAQASREHLSRPVHGIDS